MHRLLPVVLASLFVAASVSAQTATVRGFVTEARSEQALQSATVVLVSSEGLTLGLATDGDGYFSFARVPAGSHRVRVSFVGFVSFEQEIRLTAGQVLTLSVALEEGEGTLGEAVVEAEAPSGIAAVAAGLETIRPADVDRVPVPGVSGDLAAYLQTVPGVVLPGDRGGQFHIRGGAEDQNLVMLDGLPVYAPLHILSFFSAFPEEVLDGVDLYTGGFGAEYGGRMSSVMDVTARNGNKQNIAGAAAIAPFLSGIRLEGPLVPGKVSMIASGRRSLVEELTPDLFGERMAYRFGDFFGKVHALLGSRQSFSVTGLHTFDRGDLSGTSRNFLGDAISSAVTDSSELAWTNTVIGARYEVLPGRVPIRATLTGGYSGSDQEFGPESSPDRSSSIESWDGKMDTRWYLGAFDLDAGLHFRHSDLGFRLDGQFEDVPNVQSHSVTEWSGYVTTMLRRGALEIRPGARLYLVPQVEATRIEPRLRAFWTPAAGHKLSASWGVYHQAIVGLSDERDVGNVFTAWTPVARGTDLPRSMHAIVGWSGNAPASVPGSVKLAIEGYYKSYPHLQVPIFSAFPRFTTALQEADGTAYGADIRAEFSGVEFVQESLLQGRVSYSLGWVDYTTESGVEYAPAHDRRHYIQGILSASKGEVSLTVQAQYGSGLPFTPSAGFDKWYLFTPDVDVTDAAGVDRILYAEPNSARQPTYARLDVFIQRRIEKGRYVGTLRAGATNVFNRDNLFYFDLYTYKRVNQLPLVPSVGMKLELR